jgi:hypothetical protein
MSIGSRHILASGLTDCAWVAPTVAMALRPAAIARQQHLLLPPSPASSTFCCRLGAILRPSRRHPTQELNRPAWFAFGGSGPLMFVACFWHVVVRGRYSLALISRRGVPVYAASSIAAANGDGHPQPPNCVRGRCFDTWTRGAAPPNGRGVAAGALLTRERGSWTTTRPRPMW